jgi:hypothetical protein
MVLMFESGEYHNLFLDIKIPPKSLQNPSKSLQNPSKSLQNPSKSLQIPPKSLQLPPKSFQNPLECEFCNKIFTRIDNKNKHIREKRCKYLGNNSNISIGNQNNINIQNNNNVNIHINGYGKEDTHYISKEILDSIIERPLAGIPKLVEMIHLNPEYPENNNIKLINKNLPFLNYYNGEFWKTGDKSTVIGNMIKSKTAMTDDYFKDIPFDEQNESYIKCSSAVKYVITNFKFKDPLLKYKPSKNTWVKIYKKLEDDIYRMILSHRDYMKVVCEE